MINENAFALLYGDILGIEVKIERSDKTESVEELSGIDEYLSILIETWKSRYKGQEELNATLGIDLLAYNEDIYAFFRKTVQSFFGSEGIVELFQWYCTDRDDVDEEEDGDLEAHKIWDESGKEVDISTNEKFISYMKYLSTFNGIAIDETGNNGPEEESDEDGED